MITTLTPDSWQSLQEEVARILRECGFTVEVEKKLKTVRGEVEIDVYAEEVVQGRRYTILCECKHWKARIPQNVVHGFRTVIADSGANIGYIIGTSGFQTGSVAASDLTNIGLVTWEDFQNRFEQTWLDNFWSPMFRQHLSGLMSHAEPFLPQWIDDLSDDDAKQFLALKDHYTEFGWLMQDCGRYGQMLGRPKPAISLPLRESLQAARRLNAAELERALRGWPPALLDARGYREFLDQALAYGTDALARFDAFRDRSGFKRKG
jgi:restriction system protein